MVKYTEKESLMQALDSFKESNSKAKKNRVGFVPTMGALHSGHISLVEKALKENELVVVSIFVNPTQFNNPTDLEKYPRTQEDDLALLRTLGGNLFVYVPSVSDIYEEKVASKKYNFGNLENEMEGKHRQGHFDGVGTVVSKLFNIVKPNKAYFGEKDFQQLQIIKKLVEIEKMPIEIIGCPIVREKNGLALSSRNQRLSEQRRDEASIIYKVLKEVRDKFQDNSIKTLNELVVERFLTQPDMELEYFEIADEKTLKTRMRKQGDTKYRAFIAVIVDEVRLIDNMPLN